jgi:hypothetical protein
MCRIARGCARPSLKKGKQLSYRKTSDQGSCHAIREKSYREEASFPAWRGNDLVEIEQRSAAVEASA